MSQSYSPVIDVLAIDDRLDLAAHRDVSLLDDVVGTNGDDSLTGTSGDDSMHGKAGQDTLDGGAGQDLVRGDGGDDWVTGGDGDDYVGGGDGNDTMDGGAGIDRAAFFDSTVGVHVSLALQGQAQDTGEGMDLLTGFEDLSGSKFSDLLTGDDSNNWLWGDVSGDDTATGGDDTLVGGGGDDLLQVSVGDHRLAGGVGEDTVTFTSVSAGASSGVNVSLLLQGEVQDTGQGMTELKAIEDLSGTSFGDTLGGDDHANVLAGDAGSDVLRGQGGSDALYGDGGINIYGAVTAGTWTTQENVLNPDSSEVLANGADLLDGGAGADTLVGGLGSDTLTGGAGADTFVFVRLGDSPSGAPDLITDLNPHDVIDLSAIDADTNQDGDQAFTLVSHLSGVAGQAALAVSRGGFTQLQLDVNGDGVADSVIDISGHHIDFTHFVL